MSTTNQTTAAVTTLRAAAVITTIGALAQAALGGHLASAADAGGLFHVHGLLGLITMVGAVVAAVAAGMSAKNGGNRGLMWHGLTVAIMAVAQYGLGEAHQKLIHIILGVLFLIAAAGLATLAFRKPFATSPQA